jgi:integrase
MSKWSNKSADRIAVGRGRLRKLAKSGVWHFHYQNQDGNWTSKSTKHRDKAGATRWAETLSVQLSGDDLGLARPKGQVGKDVIMPALEEWLTSQRVHHTEATRTSYASIVKKFGTFLETKPKVKRLRHFTTDVAFAFRGWAIAQGNSRVTVDNNMVALRSACSYLVAKEKLAENPFKHCKHKNPIFFNAKSPKRDTYTEEEYFTILDAATKADRPKFVLLANMGFRISELAMLECTDIDTSANVIHIRNKITHDGIQYEPKDKTDRSVPINPDVHQILGEIGAKAGSAAYVISMPAPKSRRRYLERMLLDNLKRLATPTRIARNKLTLHNFRKFFISQCADCGIPMAAVMRWVGHDDMEMVMYYYQLRDKSSQEAMNTFQIRKSDAIDVDASPTEAIQPPANDHGNGSKQRSERADVVRENRTTPHAREYMGNDHEKTASQGRERGKTERGGFEPPVRFNPHTGFRNQPLQPLGHLSRKSNRKATQSGPRQIIYRLCHACQSTPVANKSTHAQLVV